MTETLHAAAGILALFVALTLWQHYARRGGAALWLFGVAAAAFGIDAVRLLCWRLIDTPGGGPALEVLLAIAAAVGVGAGLRWRELGPKGFSEAALQTDEGCSRRVRS